jgi:hypothetical protein
MTEQDRFMSVVSPLIGGVTQSIRRVWYSIGEEIKRDDGALELTFDLPAGVLLLDSAAEGDRLRLLTEPWDYAFRPQDLADPENAIFVRECGRWDKYDVSAEQPYASLVGDRLTGAKLLWREDLVVGMTLLMTRGEISLVVFGDECSVDVRLQRPIVDA